ncbi:MAG TPA: ABC transporter permease, partial [Gemmatimonadaceae bacterium]|nr:ABC transporter permease [Gemmatimonadaceae bacterium]
MRDPMSMMRRFLPRFRAVFLFGRLQREMDEEMRAHIDAATARYAARGMPEREAINAARREFGNRTVIASDARAARGARWAESVATDVRLAWRGLKRSPLFALVALVSIALGVGATTAIVTLANTLLFQAPPGVGDADRVITVGRTMHGHGFDTFSYPTYADYAAASSLDGLAGMDLEPTALSLSTPAGGVALRSGAVTGNFFRVLRARPALGRFFTPNEDSDAGASSVVVLGDHYWRARFHADSAVVGRVIDLNGQPFTVIGVAAAGFQGPFVIAPDLWIPLRTAARLAQHEASLTSRQAVWLIGVGRLAPGRSAGDAQAELSELAARLRQSYPTESDLDGVRVNPLSLVPGDGHQVIAAFMLVLFVVAALVLVVASMNVAGMLLARASGRQREIAMRISLGASRARLVRQLATESLVIGLGAGAVGVVIARFLVRALMALVPRLPVPVVLHPRLDAPVLAFALGVTLLTVLAVGALPAFQGTKFDLVPALKIGAGATAQRHRLRRVLLVSQIAVSMLLVVTASLFGRSLVRARAVDPGFVTHGITIVSLDLSLAGYDEARGAQQAAALLDRVRQVPGVRQAALASVLPLGGSARSYGDIAAEGHPAPGNHESWDVDWNAISAAYFDVAGIPIVAGRALRSADRSGAPDVAVVNETFARRLYGRAESAIGQTLRNGTLRSGTRTITIVGVARDAKYRSLDEGPLNFIYVPLAQWYDPQTNLLVRTTGTVSLAGPLRRTLAAFDARLPILDERTIDDQVATALFPQRVALWVSGSLGVVALLLALLGIYGVIAYSVAQRTREFGVRVALGATRRAIIGMVLRTGLGVVGAGMLVGAAAAFAVTRLIASFLFGVPPTDIVAFGGAALLLAAAALAASWLP